VEILCKESLFFLTDMKSSLLVCHLNVRSIVAHFPQFKECVLKDQYDLVAISETWLSPSVSDAQIMLNGYSLVRRDRGGRGGGVAIYIKNSINFNLINTSNSIEQIWIASTLNHNKFVFGCVYRPQTCDVPFFLEELELSINKLSSKCDYLYCLGDCNIDILKYNAATIKFLSFLETLELNQLIESPTRIANNTETLIDVILASNTDNVVEAGVKTVHVADHELIYCKISVGRVQSDPIFRTYRSFKHFNHDLFLKDLDRIPFHFLFRMNNIDDKVNYLTSNILNLLNLHAPLITAKISKPYAPWLTENVQLLMTKRDRARARARRTEKPEHWEYYISLRNLTQTCKNNDKKAYVSTKIHNDGASSVWKTLKRMDMLPNKNIKCLPSNLNNANNINTYFISSVPSLTPNVETLNFYKNNVVPNIDERFQFTTVTVNDVQRTMLSIKSNSTGSDGLNIQTLKLCCPVILPFLTHIFNCCLSESVFPASWKLANVMPIPKVSNPKEYKDLRPISILTALVKILEKIMWRQVTEYLVQNDILPSVQSGFRAGYSSTTALLSVTDDIFCSLDSGQLSLLILLDYSKAFDTVNHGLLLEILHFIGFDHGSIQLVGSFLGGRYQRVTLLDGGVSDYLPVTKGVPQGSIMGPLLFSIYVSRLPHYIKSVSLQMYADDTQLYHCFDSSHLAQAVDVVNQDLDGIANFSRDHCLALNPSKSCAMIFGNTSAVDIASINLKLNNEIILLQSTTKNLGVIIDKNLRFKDHVTRCIQRAYGNLKLIYSQRHSLTVEVKKLLCETLVLSQFNYADVVYGPCLDAFDVYRIQKVQNSCLRLIFGIRKYDRISHTLAKIKWLNMSNRRTLHSLCLFHRILLSKKPPYLHRKISHRTDVHNVNIRFKGLLTMPLHKTAMFQRSFSYNIVSKLNSISEHIKSLKPLAFKRAIRKIIFDGQCQALERR